VRESARWRPTRQAGAFAGTNDVIETSGRRPPMTLEAFIGKHRKAFEWDEHGKAFLPGRIGHGR
jgi:hypothetical protein